MQALKEDIRKVISRAVI